MSAVARPIFLADPVTIATRPESDGMDVLLVSRRSEHPEQKRSGCINSGATLMGAMAWRQHPAGSSLAMVTHGVELTT
jgi:hypothetical protein